MASKDKAEQPVPAAAVRALAAAVATLGHQLGFHGGTTAQLMNMGAEPGDAQALAAWLAAR